MKDAKELYTEPYFAYKKFVCECLERKYDESLVLHKHHIIPKNLGGIDDKNNIIKVSVEDHIKLHLLLSECFDESTRESIDNLRSARILNRKSIHDKMTLDKISKSYLGENNPFYGKKHSLATKEKIAEKTRKRKGLSYTVLYGEKSDSEKQKRKLAALENWQNKSQDEKDEMKRKISAALVASGANRGSKNGFAKKIKIDDMIFGSMSEACEYYKTNKYFLKKKYKLEIIEDENTKI
jgi:hypothetical protein